MVEARRRELDANPAPLPENAAKQIAAVSDCAVRARPVVGAAGLLRELGRDPSAVFAAAGLDAKLLDDPEGVVPFAAVGRLLETCADAAGCPHFGLLLGQRCGIECLGPVGALVRHSPTLKQALCNIVLHLYLHDRGAVPTFSLVDGEAMLGYTIYQPGVAGTAQIYDLTAAVTYNILVALCGPSWRPTSVLLSRAKPRDPAPYRRLFGMPPRFDAEQMLLVFAGHWLERPLPGADPILYRVLQGRISELAATCYGDLPAQVRRITCNLLLCGKGSLESVATVLSMHPRTLNRHLKRLGTGYRELRDECHRSIACQLLKDTELPISEIAARLQYANTPAFIRAFRRWNDATPAEWRAARREI